MAVGDAYVFPGFLTPVLTQLFFPKLTPLRKKKPLKTLWEKEKILVTSIFLFQQSCLSFNPSPNDKILDLAKLKAFAENKLNC